jgi:integrase/recombinase XerD
LSSLASDYELIDRFIGDCRLRGYSPETIRSHRSNLRTIARYLSGSGKSFLDLDKDVLREVLIYLKDVRKVTYKTQKSYFSALSSFYKYLNYEEIHPVNPVPAFMEHYLSRYKNSNHSGTRRLLSVEEMGVLINSILEPRDKAIVTLLAKTGIRRGELVDVDLDDIDGENQSIELKHKNKRGNQVVFFDDETAIVLNRWMRTRENWGVKKAERALFVGEHGGRLRRNGVYYVVAKHAERVGLHEPGGDRMEDHFSPHCCRHWFTTHLRRNGMSREFIKELRGDSRGEAIDIYDHIDFNELRKAYLAAIPRLGIV